MNKSQSVLPRRMAWGLIAIAIVFWVWFGIGSAHVERGGPLNWLMHVLMPGGIFLLTALVASHWRVAGGALFALEGIVALGFVSSAFLRGDFTASTLILMCLTLSLPPLAAGALFLTYRGNPNGSIR